MSTPSQTAMSRSPSLANCVDPLDALIDFSEYEQISYHSPSISPSVGSKPQLVLPVVSTPSATNTLLPIQQSLPGPSHNYQLHKQQTPIPTGALQSALAMNPANLFDNYNNYLSGSSGDDFIDFGSSPSVDLEFESPPTEPAILYTEQVSPSSEYVNPSVIRADNPSSASSLGPSTYGSNVGRLWPGMHKQQAALAKAQQQRQQQQQLIQQQRQQSLAAQQKAQRPKVQQPSDPIVEEKISQLLHTMRQGTVTSDDDRSPSQLLAQHHRLRKDEEDMDEDERLLASEEGKKLSSKERRQLRNKVSARAFRSRRKGE
jgi:hypothetical protein